MAVNKSQLSRERNAGKKTSSHPATRFQETETPFFYLIPFLFVLAVIPFIIRYKSFENNLSDQYWHGSNTTSTDIFLYWKSVFLIAFGVVLVFMLVMALVTEAKKFQFHLEFAPLTVYLVFVILSSMFTEHTIFALHGIENHFESMWVLLAYVVLAIYGATMADNAKAVRVILYGWLAGTWVLLLIGVFQAFKLDIFTTKFIKYLILPKELWGNNLKLNFDLGKVYITLYNPNYVGYFAAVTIPTFLVIAFCSKEIWKKLLFGITVIGVFICSIGSGAKNGLLALAGTFVILLIMFRKQILRQWKVLIPTFLALVALFFGITSIRDNSLLRSIKGSIQVLFADQDKNRHVDGMTCTAEGIIISYDDKQYRLSMDVDENQAIAVLMIDSEGKEVSTKLSDDGQSVVSLDKSFPFIVTPINYNVGNNRMVPSIQLAVDGYKYSFSNQLSRFNAAQTGYYYLNASGKWVTIEEAETAVFTNKADWFSGRGYIWARTIPLLKNHVILGSGPDTFALEFPNNDYVNSAYNGYLNQIVTKPHSLYLQIGVQTGVISMLAFLVFFMIYFVRSLILYWKHPLDTWLSQLGVGLMASMSGYMISGLTNDSTITYAPVFWGLMGVGIAVNEIVRKSETK